jgi:hypothetical protein
MKFSDAIVVAMITAAAMVAGNACAQTAKVVPARIFYYDDYEWPLPGDGATPMTLNGMTSVHAVWMTFSRYAGGSGLPDGPVITLLAGSTVKWSAPQGGCNYELQLVNANPPVINLIKPSSMCAQKSGAKVIFKVMAIQ